MKFNSHFNLVGKHATLGASSYHWIRYDENKIANMYTNMMAKQRGTELHDLAARCIKLNRKLPKTKETLNWYVNDAIGYKMKPEQILVYSENCFGTADAISFRNNVLRIHDLKTGETPAHIEQLMIYAALFCLEYAVKPKEIKIILRIYQSNDVIECIPEYEDITAIMDKIVSFDSIINEIKMQEDY